MKNPTKPIKKTVGKIVRATNQKTKRCVQRAKVSMLKAQNKFMGDALDSLVKANHKLATENANLRAQIKTAN